MLTRTPYSLTGEVAIIVGGASGIGRASAIALASMDAAVAILDVNLQAAEDVAKEIRDLGGSAISVAVDVADAEACRSAVDSAQTHMGRIDHVVIAAGINGAWGHFDKIAADLMERTFRVNVLGTCHIVQSAMPHMKERGGSITLISSINGTRVWVPGLSVYAASKAAQLSLMKSLATELGPYGIRVNAICPGGVKETNIGQSTQWFGEGPLGRPKHFPEGSIPLTGKSRAVPDDVAWAVLYLCSGLSRHVSGTELFVDGAESIG